MQAVRSIKNQYLGVNAHLHSYWQGEGGWAEFHTRHMVYLADALKPLLLPIGYTAALEPSLQLRRLDETEPTEFPESDITLYDLDRSRTGFPPMSAQAAAGELVLPIPETLFASQISEKSYNAVKLYELKPQKAQRGEPVVWIELLSPSNKPGGRDGEEYLNKRLKIIESGIVLIELDYLHESAPTLRGLASYRRRGNRPAEQGAHPYRILMVDPRPQVMEGVVRVNQFDVDAPIPTLTIPLRGQDSLTFDFGLPYHKTIEGALYGLELVDYRELPLNFNRYDPADQARIAMRMLAVLEAAYNHMDLEHGPFSVQVLPLEIALAQIQQRKAELTAG